MIRLLLCAALAFGTEAQSVADMLAAMEKLHARQERAHPLDARVLEERIAAYGAPMQGRGQEAVWPLVLYLADAKHPLKVRLYAAAFLGLIGDPLAMPALESRADDPREDAGLRAAALQAIGSLKLKPEQLRAIFDGVAAERAYPPAMRREALNRLAELGSDDPESMLRAAKGGGPVPKGPAEAEAEAALAALGRSSKTEAKDALVSALGYFRPGARVRAQALAALKRRELKAADFSLSQLRVIAAAAWEDPGPTSVDAARLLGGYGDRRSVELLIQTLRSRNPAVIAEAAESLARIGDASAVDPLSKVASSLHEDPRFVPRKGEEDPSSHAVRIQQALEALQSAVSK